MLLLAGQGVLNAQFYSDGNESALTKWSHITTASYDVIYPAGMDSLGRVYARNLELVKNPVSGSLGFVPGESYSRRTPVVLHPYSSISNGMVVWSPRRMELYTVPNSSSPDAVPWDMHLTLHESRHVAQMQPFAQGIFKPATILTGELLGSALSAFFGGLSSMEGDAVLAETSLTTGGRGRSADFLEYQRACFLAGEMRDYWKWRYGSLTRYTPDYYRTGYISMAGMRAIAGKKDWPFNAIGKDVVRSFDAAADTLRQQWLQLAAARAPFMPYEVLVDSAREYVEYTRIAAGDSSLYAIRSGYYTTPHLVRVDTSGNVESLCAVPYSASRLKYSGGVLFWSEIVGDTRWEMNSYSVIRRFDTVSGESTYITSSTRYFNPSVSADGRMVAAVAYNHDTSSSIDFLDSGNGALVSSIPVPSGLQVVETAWIGGTLYCTGITREGFGIYEAGTWNPVLKGVLSKIKQLDSRGGALTFVSDPEGVDELYSLDISTSGVSRLTRSIQGSGDHAVLDGALYYSYLLPGGRTIRRTPLEALEPAAADLDDRFENTLTKDLAAAEPVRIDYDAEVPMSDPMPYSRLANGIRIHSWVPAYFNYDIIDNLSFNNVLSYAGLGATLFFQNTLATLSGSLAASAGTFDGAKGPGIEAKIRYSGLYPVMELNYGMRDEGLGKPFMEGSFRTYIPFSFSKGGWSRGLIPQISLRADNVRVETPSGSGPGAVANISVRGYSMLPTAHSAIYPRLGIGAEAGIGMRPLMMKVFAPSAYAYIYGYVPGLDSGHGIRMSAMGSRVIGEAAYVNQYVNDAPRGNHDALVEMSRYRYHGKLTFDYGFAFAPVDLSTLSPVTYVRNFELIAHHDWGFYYSKAEKKGWTASAGADLIANLGNVLWLQFPTRIGVSCNYCYGNLVEDNPLRFSTVFSMDF